MKIKFVLLILILSTTISCGQNQKKTNQPDKQKVLPNNGIYQLFPTKNVWTFIKLDTRNGKMWQVHFGVNDENNTGELVLNSNPLVIEDKEVNGRFILYPTENMYNFLLLDQIDGNVTQVQWSMEAKNRGIVSVIKQIE
jgi:hypothetical protein